MPNPQGPPPSREEFLASLYQYDLDSRTSKAKTTRIKKEHEIGDGVPESETLISRTPDGYRKDQVDRISRFGCGCLKPESQMAATCQALVTRKQRCGRIICKDCAKEKVCYDCAARLCEDHLVRVPSGKEVFYFCEDCARRRAGRTAIKAIFRALLAPFLVKEEGRRR